MTENLLARAVKLAGGPAAGVLLYRIAYWQPRAGLRIDDGPPVTAKTREEWCVETGLTRHQYDGAVRVLREQGLIEVSYHMFSGRRVSHARLTGDALTLMTESGIPDSGESENRTGGVPIPDRGGPDSGLPLH